MLGTCRRILGVHIFSCCIEGPLPRAKNCRCNSKCQNFVCKVLNLRDVTCNQQAFPDGSWSKEVKGPKRSFMIKSTGCNSLFISFLDRAKALQSIHQQDNHVYIYIYHFSIWRCDKDTSYLGAHIDSHQYKLRIG